MASNEIMKTTSVYYRSGLIERRYEPTNKGRFYLAYPDELPEKYWDIDCNKLVMYSPDEEMFVSREDLYGIYGGSIFLVYFSGRPDENFVIGKYYGIWNKTDPEKEERIRIDILTNNKAFAEKQIKEMYGKDIGWLW